MSSEEFTAYLTDMEQEIRQADRDMRDIEALEKRGVLNAGKLSSELAQAISPLYFFVIYLTQLVYDELLPRLQNLITAHEEDLHTAANLEKRIGALLQRYSTQVCLLFDISTRHLAHLRYR